MNFQKDIDFIDSFNKERNRITKNIVQNLPCLEEIEQNNNKLKFISFSKLDENWGSGKVNGKSVALEALADKIRHMIFDIGCPNSVKPMLESICKNKIKKQTQKYKQDVGSFLGYGHFRWDRKAYKLTKEEIERVKSFFNI